MENYMTAYDTQPDAEYVAVIIKGYDTPFNIVQLFDKEVIICVHEGSLPTAPRYDNRGIGMITLPRSDIAHYLTPEDLDLLWVEQWPPH